MDIKEKNELIEVIKTDIKNVASLEAKGQFEEAKKMHSELEGETYQVIGRNGFQRGFRQGRKRTEKVH
jgi:rRNA pseudouridine-1189 N-methylase Emg1 (Nep1/Mra1 family)